jgi:hypothetical protein
MARTLYVAPVPPLNVTAGAAYNTSVTLTDVSPTPQIVLPANLLDVGQVLRLTAFGLFSTTVAPTLLLGFYYGGVAGTALAATGATTTASGAVTLPFRLEYEGRVRSTGSAGTIMGSGWLNLATALTSYSQIPIPATALATVTIDTTSAKQLTVGAQWGTSSASNTLTCHHFSAELIG